jgi:hypothetical protein
MREEDGNICDLVIILLNFIKKTIFRSQCYLFARFLFAESVRLDFFSVGLSSYLCSGASQFYLAPGIVPSSGSRRWS